MHGVAQFRSRLAVVLAVLGSTACSEPSLDADFGGKSWETAHYVYRYREGDDMACAEVGDSLEAYGKLLVDTLGIDADAWTKTRYYKYPSSSSFEAERPCRRGTARACTDSEQLFAVPPLLGHELVHNVMAKRTSTEVPVLLAEGLANALTCAPRTLPGSARWDFRTFGSPPTEPDVAQAGRLVLGLLQHVTPRDLMDMLAAGTRDESLEQLRQRLIAGWGLDLEAVQAETEASGLGACVPLYACSGAPLPEGASRLTANCHGFDPVTLPSALGAISVRVTGTAARFMPCDPRQALSPIARVSPFRTLGDWEYWLQPPSSAHALWLDGAEYVEQPLVANVDLSKLPGAFSATCAGTSGPMLERDRQIAIVVDGSQPVLHFPLSFAAASRLVLDWQKGPEAETFRVPTSPVAVSWCTECNAGAAANCQELDRVAIEAQSIDVSGSGVLRLLPSAALGKAAVLQLTVRAVQSLTP